MANSKQAEKRIRRNERRREINIARKSRIRTYLKKVETALASGDAEGAKTAFQAAEPEMMRGVSRGVLHKNTAARKISRLSHRIKTLQQA